MQLGEEQLQQDLLLVPADCQDQQQLRSQLFGWSPRLQWRRLLAARALPMCSLPWTREIHHGERCSDTVLQTQGVVVEL